MEVHRRAQDQQRRAGILPYRHGGDPDAPQLSGSTDECRRSGGTARHKHESRTFGGRGSHPSAPQDEELMLAGVTVEFPETVTIDPRVQVGSDTVIEPYSRLLGKSLKAVRIN